VYLGVFDMNQRLEQTRKVLREKKHLKKLIEEDISELEQDVQELEAMLNQYTTTVPR
jgi:prefoldin subunit 5